MISVNARCKIRDIFALIRLVLVGCAIIKEFGCGSRRERLKLRVVRIMWMSWCILVVCNVCGVTCMFVVIVHGECRVGGWL